MTEVTSQAVKDLLAALHRGRNEEWYQWILRGKPRYTEHEYQQVLRDGSKKRDNIKRAKLAEQQRKYSQ